MVLMSTKETTERSLIYSINLQHQQTLRSALLADHGMSFKRLTVKTTGGYWSCKTSRRVISDPMFGISLKKNGIFALLARMDSRYQDLVKEIVEKAAGVFLWVVLVVRSFKEGIANADTISILTKRLRGLPSDLEKFFEHMLSQVDKVY